MKNAESDNLYKIYWLFKIDKILDRKKFVLFLRKNLKITMQESFQLLER